MFDSTGWIKRRKVLGEPSIITLIIPEVGDTQ